MKLVARVFKKGLQYIRSKEGFRRGSKRAEDGVQGGCRRGSKGKETKDG